MGAGMGMASDQQWLQLALTGLMIALLPLSYAWVKGRRDRYRQLVWLTLFLTFDLILFGGFTRLTDSGLGCPDWPGCYGTANPFLAILKTLRFGFPEADSSQFPVAPRN